MSTRRQAARLARLEKRVWRTQPCPTCGHVPDPRSNEEKAQEILARIRALRGDAARALNDPEGDARGAVDT
jgi:hypothetical protein